MNEDRRSEIEKTVERNPGISFSEIKRKTGFPNGVLQYHLKRSDEVEKKRGAVLRKGRCDECVFRDKCGERCLYALLRKPLKKEILRLESEGLNQSEIAERLDRDRSTINYHFQDLREAGFL